MNQPVPGGPTHSCPLKMCRLGRSHNGQSLRFQVNYLHCQKVGQSINILYPVGTIRNLSPNLWKLQHLTSLYLNDNNLQRIPPEISRLTCLLHLDLSCNKLRNLPPEIGELTTLRELYLHNNYLRTLPLEMGKLFKLQILRLKGNPLSADLMSLYSEVNGTDKVLSYLLDNLPSESPLRLLI